MIIVIPSCLIALSYYFLKKSAEKEEDNRVNWVNYHI